MPTPRPAPCLILLLALAQGCASGGTRAPKAGPALAASGAPAAVGEPSGLARGAVMTRGPTGLALPVVLRSQPLAERQFAVAATRALRRAYEEDCDDPALLLALVHRLNEEEALAPVRALWQPQLEAGLARAELLGTLGPGLRALRRAYAAASVEAGTGRPCKLDAAACRTATAALADAPEAAQRLVVTIEPMGPKPLAAHLRPCGL